MTPVADQVIALWQAWVSKKSGRQRRYYQFYQSVIRNNEALEEVSLDQVLEILVVFEPLRPWRCDPKGKSQALKRGFSN
jgi:hypothetical protein